MGAASDEATYLDGYGQGQYDLAEELKRFFKSHPSSALAQIREKVAEILKQS